MTQWQSADSEFTLYLRRPASNAGPHPVSAFALQFTNRRRGLRPRPLENKMDDIACSEEYTNELIEYTVLSNENAGLGNPKEIKERKSFISPYNVFFSEYLQQQENVCRDSFGQMSKNASVIWSNMEETEKERFVKASQEKELSTVKSNGEPSQCCKCGKKLRHRTSLKIHEAECGKTFSCSVCSKEFSSGSHLRRHQKFVHDRMKLHQCKLCDANFSTVTDLRRHCISHTRLPQFSCHVCNSPFMYKNNLLRHIKKVHP